MTLEQASLWVSMIAVVFAAATVFVAARGVDQTARQGVADRKAADDARKAADDRAAADRVAAEVSSEAHRAVLLRLAEEQARPYVVVSMELSVASAAIVDLVVRNYGHTAATDVVVTVEPALTRTKGTRLVEIPAIPTLAPGQAWRTFWDSTVERHGNGLPDHHVAHTTYTDSRGHELSTDSTLDWATYWGVHYITVYGVHEVATALRDMNSWAKKQHKTAQRWAEPPARDAAGDHAPDD